MRKLWVYIGLSITFLLSLSAISGLTSSVYDWEKIPAKKIPTGEFRSFFSSSTRSLNSFEITAISQIPGEEGNQFNTGKGFEELIIVKEGKIDIRVKGDQRILGEGSVIVVPPGEEISIINPLTTNAVYYLITFNPLKKADIPANPEVVPTLFIDWRDLEFKPSANGGRRNVMQQKTTTLKDLEIHVTTLKEGLPSHAAHVHPDEEIILVKKGYVEQTIKGVPYKLGPGSVIFLTNDDLHGIGNAGTGECEYYAIRWLVN
jgi:quercetin dioxygenase-like cupin family protein